MVSAKRSEGLNESEQRLVALGRKVFLEFWSYPNVYYNPGKELTDLLVVCDNHVLIFSDKEIKFDDKIDISTAWQRWHNKAILHSIKQLRKAERKIRDNPDKVFLDAKCQNKIPIPLPNAEDMKIHLICIANGIKEACKKQFGDGCTGSLIFSKDLRRMISEQEDFKNFMSVMENNGAQVDNKLLKGEFHITDYDPQKTFVHIFDDYSFPFVLNELDTIKDFVDYLDEKSRFIRKALDVIYTGEEDLLLHYVKNFDYKRNCHIFMNTPDEEIERSFCTFFEEDWDRFKKNPQYITKKEEDRISYMWDKMIQKTSIGILSGETKSEKPEGSSHEGAIRYMVLENRVNRRMLCLRMKQAYESFPISQVSTHSDLPYVSLYYDYGSRDKVYFFLQLMPLPSDSYVEYRKKRRGLLEIYGMCLKAKFVKEVPNFELKRIIAIGTEPPFYSKTISEDFLLIDCSEWTAEQQKEYSALRDKLQIWRVHIDNANKVHSKEYPDISPIRKVGRNDPCYCGSGIKYKKCCGR